MTKLPDYSELFLLEDPFASRPFRLEPVQDWAMEKDWLLFRTEWQPQEPVLFKANMGGSPADFLWTSFPPFVCISQHVVDVLKENQLSGWATYPVEVYDRKGQHLPGYHGFAVKSSVGKQDVSKSAIIDKPPIVPGGKSYQVYKGMYFDESKWDGSDIFVIEAGFKVVTRRVRDAFIRAKVSNVRFIALEESEHDVFNYTLGYLK